MASDNLTIENNIVYDNFGANIYFERTWNSLIQKNIIYSTNDSVFRRGGNPSAGIGGADELHQFYGEERVKQMTIINCLTTVRY